MKKSAIALAVFAAALFAVSCQKENGPASDSGAAEFTPMTICAESEGIGVDVKAEMAYKYDLLWQENDEIIVKNASNSATFTLAGGEGTTKGTFYCEQSPFQTGDAVEAFYPGSIVSGADLVWPSILTTDKTVPMYSKKTLSATKNETFNFASLGSVLQLMFSTSSAHVVLKSIEVKANEAMSGKFTISDGKAVIEQPAEGNKPGVVLDLGQGIAIGVTAKKFNIAIPAGSYSDLTITFTAIDGQTCIKHATKAQVFEHNTVGRLNVSGEFKRSLPAGVLLGKFSVSNTKQVRFSQGNLYWDSVLYKFEDSQFSSSWNETDHVGLFFWSKDASVARGESYWDEAASTSDIFFTNVYSQKANPDFTVNGETGKFRSLSTEEWEYLLKKRKNAAELFKNDVTVCGEEHCLVIAPDICLNNYAFNKTKTSYDASEWATAEAAGVICLPSAGYRNNKYASDEGDDGFYWTSTPSDNIKASSFGLQEISVPIPVDVTLLNDTPSTSQMFGWGTGFQLGQETVSDVLCYKISTTTATDPSGVQFAYDFGSPFEVGVEYVLKIKAKASHIYAMGVQLQHTADNNYYSCGDFEKINLSSGWQEITVSTVCSNSGGTRLVFSIGGFVGDIHIEKVVLLQKAAPKLDFSDTPENDQLTGWGNFSKSIVDDAGRKCYRLETTSAGTNPWDTQFAYFFARPFKQDRKYTIKMKLSSNPSRELNGNFQNSTTYASGGSISLGDVLTERQELFTVATCSCSDANSIVFNIGDIAGTLDLERFSIVEDDFPESTSIGVNANKRYFGLSVRLVCDVEKEGSESDFDGGEILNF